MTGLVRCVSIRNRILSCRGEYRKLLKVDLDRQVLKPMCKDGGRVYAYSSPEYVKDMGTPERFEQVCADFTSGVVRAKNLSRPQKAVFLDRDGVINRYMGFLRDISDFELIDGVAKAIRIINDSGYLCIVVTNQPVIARGEVTRDELDEIHAKMETMLGKEGAYIDGLYVCPHHPDKGFKGEIPELKVDCDCRKPKPGMLLKAAEEYNIDLSQSWMIGDSWRDVAAGEAAGVKTVLLDGDGSEGIKSYKNRDDGCVPTMRAGNLLEATKLVLCQYWNGFGVQDGNSSIPLAELWEKGNEQNWISGLRLYYGKQDTVEKYTVERKMEIISLDQIESMDGEEFYRFLYYDYFVWKYTAKNRLASCRKYLKRLDTEEGKQFLKRIKDKLFVLYGNDSKDTRSLLKCVKEISGLGTAGASGLLSILFPNEYGTVDQFVVKSLCRIYSKGDSDSDKKKELEKIYNRKENMRLDDGVFLIDIYREKADKLNRDFGTDKWTPRKIDMVLWAYRDGKGRCCSC